MAFNRIWFMHNGGFPDVSNHTVVVSSHCIQDLHLKPVSRSDAYQNPDHGIPDDQKDSSDHETEPMHISLPHRQQCYVSDCHNRNIQTDMTAV